jgi:D-alanine-D-alanine ligase
MSSGERELRVAVLCGGISNEREVSLRSGALVAKHLSKRFPTAVIEIATDGQWLLPAYAGDQAVVDSFPLRPLPEQRASEQIEPRRAATLFDVVFVALHGKYGEDGRVQSILDLSGIPYTGSGVLASALAMNKYLCRRLMETAGVFGPKQLLVEASLPESEVLSLVREGIGFPCVVKPNESGSSIGISIVHHPDELLAAIREARAEDSAALVDEYVRGRELTCGVLGNTGSELRALPVVEIMPEHHFFDYYSKYSSVETREVCPAEIDEATDQAVRAASLTVHETLRCDGLTRSDFILGPDGRLLFLEVNTIPGLTEQSLCPKEAAAMGISLEEFLALQIDLALRKAEQGGASQRRSIAG